MKQFSRNENGQFEGNECIQIKEEWSELIKPFLEKYSDIDTADLSLLCDREFSWQLTRSKLKFATNK